MAQKLEDKLEWGRNVLAIKGDANGIIEDITEAEVSSMESLVLETLKKKGSST